MSVSASGVKFDLPDTVIASLRPFYVQGKGRLFDHLAPASGEREAVVFGYRTRLDLRDTIQRQVYLGTFEPRETRLVSGMLRKGMTIIDIGANVGYFTLLAARLVGPEGRVIAIEPSPYAAGRLEATIAANGITSVSVHRIALGDARGATELFLPPEESGNHSPNMVTGHPDGVTVRVDVGTLDECAADWNLQGTIDLVKLDVEGYEPRVLDGAARLLSEKRIGAILCELNGSWLLQAGSSRRSLAALLADNGFVTEGGITDPDGSTVSTHLFELAR